MSPDEHREMPTPTEAWVRRMSMRLVTRSMDRPKAILLIAGLVTIVLGAMFVRVQIDTDPENMLSADTPVRVRNADLRATFGSTEMIVVGVFGDTELTTPEHLAAAGAVHERLAAVDGVAESTLVSVQTAFVDGIAPDAAGVDEFVTDLAADPILGGSVLSGDGDTLAFFVPLDSKSDAQTVRDAANDIVDATPTLAGLERHIAGLPLAQEAFGDQMFVQMAVFAPLAGLAIFVLMLLFFRRLVLVGPAMVLAMVAVIWTMGLLIGTGNTLHIMSSMIPIFLMPIAILDAVHVISEFFDRFAATRDRRAVLHEVYSELARPIAFTSVTTAVGFGALALTPIPPVQVFGVFIAIGVAIAWLATLTLLPAILMLVPTASIDRAVGTTATGDGRFAAIVRSIPHAATAARRPALGLTVLVAVAAVPLLATIEVNDNPVNWFRSGHDVRVASERLNDELPGTFAANLVIDADTPSDLTSPATIQTISALQERLQSMDEVGTVVSYVDVLGGAIGEDATVSLAAAREQSILTSTLITDDGERANIRLQLHSGDNQAMSTVVDAAEQQLAADPLANSLSAEWAGESYLNLVWQDEMVAGMLVGFAVTLAVVLILLVVLFRSVKWALLAIAPVLWTILVVYGIIGLLGKDFDMPIAVLSTMVLGIGVDFAIHFVERFRELVEELGSTSEALAAFGEEPARALSRNAAVIAVGFTPLLFSSLTPYVIVGLFLASIIVLSWLMTVVALPAAVSGQGRNSL